MRRDLRTMLYDDEDIVIADEVANPGASAQGC
jgi:hypothetical protein